MAAPTPPSSYATWRDLPEVSFQHVPADSPTVTRTIIILIDRPARNNAFTDAMQRSLTTAFYTVSSDPRVKAVVLAGNDPSNRFFCAGMDLDGATASQQAETKATSSAPPTESQLHKERMEFRDSGGILSLAIHRCRKPVIAALNGSAVGIGMTMTLPCTIRIASSAAKCGFVFSRRGINMEACSSFFLPRLIGTSKAMQLLTTGAIYKPTDPAIRDLFAEVVSPDRVVPRAVALAEELAAKTSSVATAAMKDMIYSGNPQTPEGAHILESQVFYDLFRGKDSKEGIISFLQKREPDFKATWDQDRPKVWPWFDENAEEGWHVGKGLWNKSKL